MSVMDARAEAVAATMAAIRAIEAEKGVTREALEDIKVALVGLAARTELFPRDSFPVPAGRTGMIYRLSEDADYRFALYASAGVPGKAQPPHNHTTWASIAGVYGDEHNVFYERIDNRATPGEGRLRKTGEMTVQRGNAVGFLPDDFHTIEVRGAEPSLHLHVYGRSLERLPERIHFASSDGGPYEVFPANPNIVTAVVQARDLKAMLHDGDELALLDVREEAAFAGNHLLFAVPCPLSRLEARIAALVPRRTTRVVLCDDGGELAQRAATRLMHLGYRNLAVLDGGVRAWAAAGHELFSGVHVPSKAFGEFVELREGTPHLSAEEIKAKMDAGDDMIVLDSRPIDEFRRMNIPGGIDCPGAELVYRFHEAVTSPDTLVVVNCAGRTRSIIGAQSLINAGVPNRVVALRNGTMGWKLAGYELETGQTRAASPPGEAARVASRAAAERVARRFGVRTIGRDGLGRFEAERERRSLYVLDVRSPDEYAAGHLPGARSAPGGQLVQATDEYVGTRNARLVLVDSDGVRARMTASWLAQMGWDEVFVLDGVGADAMTETGPEPVTVLGLDEAKTETIAPEALKAALGRGAAVIDLDTSLRYRAGHIPGAWWAMRTRLAGAVAKVGPVSLLVLTSPDGRLARLAAAELTPPAGVAVKALDGGTDAWRAAGLPLEVGDTRLADAPADVWYKPYDHGTGIEGAMRAYLTWEVGLVPQVERDGDARFRFFPRD